MDSFFEPFRIKSVERIRRTTVEERERYLREADFNLFRIRSRNVMIDLLTDSGTSAMSAEQWSALMLGDESYAGAESFYRFEAAVRTLMPFKHIIPTHQGRAAEAILVSLFGGPGRISLSNTHFDTTRANIELSGATAIDLNIAEGREPALEHPFKGNIDLARLKEFLKTRGEEVSMVMTTITNNGGGGQPVSLENIRGTSQISRAYGKPFFIDGCRFAENAYFIKLREPGYANRTVPEIVHEIFSLADGMTMSAKKDGLANIGGWIALNDDWFAQQARNQLIITEGFPTYGGLAGRDLEAIAAGLAEVVEEDYLEYRIGSTNYLGQRLIDIGVPIVRPVGGHAVYVDAKALLPHIEPLSYPGQALAVALYRESGIRSVEVGSVMFAKQPDGSERPAPMELLRLALPRRVYTKSHLDYVVDAMGRVAEKKDRLRGFSITWQPPAQRHFSAHFKEI